MTARNANQIEQLVKSRLPGYRLSPESSKVRRRQAPSGSIVSPSGADSGRKRRPRATVDSTTPSIDDLRRKFLRPGPAIGVADGGADATEHEEADIVLVEPVGDGGGRRARPKAVVLDAKGRILGAQ